MTPKGFSGVTCRSMSVVVVTALVLMDTVATDVGEDDCFWSDKTINCFKIRLNIDEKLLKTCWIMKCSKRKIGCIPPSSRWGWQYFFFTQKENSQNPTAVLLSSSIYVKFFNSFSFVTKNWRKIVWVTFHKKFFLPLSHLVVGHAVGGVSKVLLFGHFP